jgi:hypothetical protein
MGNAVKEKQKQSKINIFSVWISVVYCDRHRCKNDWKSSFLNIVLLAPAFRIRPFLYGSIE